MASDYPKWLAGGRGVFVAVDNAWVLDGTAIRLDLDVFEEVNWEGEVECRTEDEIRAALVARGADEESASRVAAWVWTEKSQYLNDTSG